MAAPKRRDKAEDYLKDKGYRQLSGKRGNGSHQVWQNDDGVSITVPSHGKEIPAGTWRSIERAVEKAVKDAEDKAKAAQAKAEAEKAQKAAGGVARAGGKSRGSDDKGKGASRHDGSKKRGWGRG